MAFGVECRDENVARLLASRAFAKGLIVECCGPQDQVLKLFPALTISDAELEKGLEVLLDAFSDDRQ